MTLVFTAPNDTRVEIDGLEVIRIRRSLYGENPEAATRIDWGVMNLVKEPAEQVVREVSGVLPSLTSLTGGKDAKLWFDAKKVKGPFPVPENMKAHGYKSSIKLMGYRQYVFEDHETVRAVLTSARATDNEAAA